MEPYGSAGQQATGLSSSQMASAMEEECGITSLWFFLDIKFLHSKLYPYHNHPFLLGNLFSGARNI